MLTVFAEYRVKDEERERYLAWIAPLRDEAGFELYEGTDQASLFVEIWTVVDEGAYAALKKERLDDPDSVWRKLEGFAAGRLAKVHMWAFRKV